MRKQKIVRHSQGFSITELMLTAILLGVSMAVISELVVLTTLGTLRITNKAEGLTAARIALNRISTDVRHARAVGDFYGQGAGRLKFPDPNNNPLYPSPPVSTPWNPDMSLSSSVLVLQIPVFYLDPNNPNNPANGFPVMLPRGAVDGTKPLYNLENLDTVVYQVIPDPIRTNEYLLQVARFPGHSTTLASTSLPAINPPQTILKGLIGPQLNGGSTSLPAVFSYLARNQKPYTALAPLETFKKVTPNPSNVDLINGVGIDLEVKSTGRTSEQGDGRYPQLFGIHTEAFMRSNHNMRLNNTN